MVLALIELYLVVSGNNAVHLAALERYLGSFLCSQLLVVIERTDSVWYPSVTLYRQKTLKDWDSVAWT